MYQPTFLSLDDILRNRNVFSQYRYGFLDYEPFPDSSLLYLESKWRYNP